jgi:hypothetical protein
LGKTLYFKLSVLTGRICVLLVTVRESESLSYVLLVRSTWAHNL